MTVQQWVTTSQLTHVGGTRREAVAFAAEHGVAGAVLSDLAIAVSELLTNVVLHGESADNVTISVDVRDDAVTLVVRGAGVGLSPHVKGAAVRMGLVALAAVAENLRICPTPDGGREVSMLLRRTAPAGSVVNGQSPR